MQVILLAEAVDSTMGGVHKELNTRLITEDLTFQLVHTGGPTAVTITIYGSVDGNNFEPMAVHDAIADGNMFHIIGKNVRYVSAAATTLSGGTGPTVTLELDYE